MGRRSKHKTRRADVKELTKAKKKLRSQARSVAATSNPLSPPPPPPPPPPAHTVDSLLAKAAECVDSFQLELACKFCQRAVASDPDDVRPLDMMAPLLLELGETDKAIECLKTSISLRPDEGCSKYLELGQLMSGTEAVGHLRRGIELMTSGREEEGACPVGGASNDDISSAYCSLAEVYLTDECFASDAGKLCYECCSKALEWSPSNPDAHNLTASCLLSQSKEEEAKDVLLQGLSLWLPVRGKTTEASPGAPPSQTSAAGEGGAGPDAVLPPPYPSRVNCAKLLLELGEHERAFDVLEGLMCEDDEVVFVWYLMGWLHYCSEERDSARFYLQQTQTLYSKLECDDTALLEHTTELLEELGPEDGSQDDCNQDDRSQGDEDQEGGSDMEVA